ncbi:MAG: gliding motility-associated ABC transporter permease subunit GldF, partial [Bacteroidetes bacterium SW_10_40_5]
MWTILKKEVNIFFSSLIAYIVISVFLIATGLFVWVLPQKNVFDYGYATLEQMFNIAPWVFMFLIPAITMRFFSEERNTGTLEIITTKPISDLSIVGG